MTDETSRPQYGEYATPEQQAAAMGRIYTPPPAPETRVSIPVVPGAAAPPEHEQQLRFGGNVVDRFVTIFQLGIGLVFLINSDYFHFAEDFNTGSTTFGGGPTLPVSFDRFGWVLLAANVAFYIGTTVLAYSRLRHRKLAFFIPLLGVTAFSLVTSALILFAVYG
jgi:Family of unknown function (DUF6264)